MMEELFDGDILTIVLMGMAAAAVFLIAAGGFLMLRTRGDVTRRSNDAAGGAALPGGQARPQPASSLIKFMGRQFNAGEEKETKLLRSRLIQAGYFDPMAGAWFFLWRFAGALSLAPAFWFAANWGFPDVSATLIHAAGMGGAVIGYLAPTFVLDRIIGKRKLKIREGFPDFMDLMVVCAEAGLSMEAAMERISRELAKGYPALSDNVTLVCLEMRAGRTLSDALMRMAQRVAVDEARSFATLLQQSEELGSSLTQALRVYSDEMRNKRMMRAEEKAYALPAKMVVPLTLFVFPILIVTLIMPVIVRVYNQ